MSNRGLTLLELHFDGDVQLGPKRIGRGGSDDTTERTRPDVDTARDRVKANGHGRLATVGVLGLVIVFVGITVLKKLLGRGKTDDLELDAESVDVL